MGLTDTFSSKLHILFFTFCVLAKRTPTGGKSCFSVHFGLGHPLALGDTPGGKQSNTIPQCQEHFWRKNIPPPPQLTAGLRREQEQALYPMHSTRVAAVSYLLKAGPIEPVIPVLALRPLRAPAGPGSKVLGLWPFLNPGPVSGAHSGGSVRGGSGPRSRTRPRRG